jgi:hypothetical protein
MSEAETYVPLELELIDEGRYLSNVNDALVGLQAGLIEHVKQYQLKAVRAKAVLKAEITLVCIDPEQGAYACLAQIKTTPAPAPPAASMLMSGKGQTDENCLLCRKSGSSSDSPRQKVFLTETGEKINPETGEVENYDESETKNS